MGLRRLVRTLLFGRPDGLRRRLFARWSGRPRPSGRAPAPPVSSAPPAAPEADGFIDVLDAGAVPAGALVEVVVEGEPVVVCRAEGGLHAVGGVCPHAGGPIADGDLEGHRVTCPWHGWSFDVRDGSTAMADDIRLATYDVRVRDGRLGVRRR